ncbi:MAG TPA: hypothetical protein VNV66_17695, partial [Pilimelia sp.]|nr:hypothetical protein [Pilimelia sp.]
MRDELQHIVDGLAARLGRPALVEDRRQLVLAYSAHTGPTDPVRRASILHRHAAPEVVAWLAEVGVAQAYAPVRTPPCAQLGLLPRVCVPLRHEELLLGFLWFIDADPGMTDADLAAAARLAQDLALALYRENLLGELAGGWEAAAVRALLAADGPSRRRAARALAEEGAVAGDAPTTAVVAQLPDAGRRDAGEGARMALEQALVATRRWCGPRAALHLVRRDHGVLLLTGTRAAGQPCPKAAARHLDEALLAAAREPDRTGRTTIGIGGTRTGLAEAFACYAEARQAARVGGRQLRHHRRGRGVPGHRPLLG